MQAEHAPAGSKSRANGPSSARLGGARADFVAGLGRKVNDLKAALGKVRGDASDLSVRDDLRRKLHALGSSAKMMKFDAMDRALSESLGTLDRSSRERPLEEVDMAAIEQTIDDLPALAWGDGHARSSRAEAELRKLAPKWSVLVVGSPLIAEALLDEENGAPTFVCQATPDAQAAYDLVRTTEPDLLVLDADLLAAPELVEALMDDPLTETVPIVVVGSFLEHGEAARYIAMGVAKTIGKPTSREALRAVCEQTLAPDRGAVAAYAVLGEPTLEELGERLALEIREAIIGRADPSARSRRIALGQGTEVLGAVWGAIARVREVVTARSDGQIRFAGGPEGALTPAPLLDPDVARADRLLTGKRGAAAEVRLSGRRIVVADDDPGVVWFLADLLKTAGCTVHEAFDGQQALELAYKTSPDLVISDILMPHIDGFSLCRALKRDVALRDTPVILLSWKEDLLQRVRELGAGAAGYVRKESDTRAIIARVREALQSRGRIETRLREDGEVRGRLDGVSVRTLLEVVCATRPEARVSIRDASFLYEVEIRLGAPHRATRTDGEGSFLSGSKVLAQMLGVSAGRFTVTTSTTPVEASLDGNLASQLAKPIARARAAMSLLNGADMAIVSRVRLDEEALVDYLKATPERARLVARRLANGAPPRELVLCGGCEPALLDDLMTDLAARGLVIGVDGLDGEDLLFPAVAKLLPLADARAAFAPRTATPEPIPALAEALPVDACVKDDAPLCESPDPGIASALVEAASLEDAVLSEVAPSSPSAPASLPEEEMFPFASPSGAVESALAYPRNTPNPLFVDASPIMHAVTATPPAEQIIALGEPTIVDSTIYASQSPPSAAVAAPTPSAPASSASAMASEASDAAELAAHSDEEDVIISMENSRPCEMTPFAAVMHDGPPPAVPAKKKKWPMVAFVAATAIVAWAVLHFSTTSASLPRQNQRQAPPAETALPPPAPAPVDTVVQQDKADEVYYTPVAAEAAIPAGHGVIDVSAPDGAVVLVDGKERARGSATVPISSGNHEVRVRRPSADERSERGCTIDVHSSRVAHVRF